MYRTGRGQCAVYVEAEKVWIGEENQVSLCDIGGL